MKTVFKNKWFYRLLIIYILLLLLWNTFLVVEGNLLGLLAIVIEISLLILLFNKHRLAKPAINFFAILLTIGAGLTIIGKIIKLLTGDEFNAMADSLVQHLLLFTFGIIIFYFNKTTVFVRVKSQH